MIVSSDTFSQLFLCQTCIFTSVKQYLTGIENVCFFIEFSTFSEMEQKKETMGCCCFINANQNKAAL